MKDSFKKLSENIKFEPSQGFAKVQLEEVKYLKEKNKYFMSFICPSIIEFSEMQEFLIKLNKNFQYKTSFVFKPLDLFFNEESVMNYLYWIIHDFQNRKPLALALKECCSELKDNILSLTLDSQSLLDELKSIKSDIERIMKNFGFIDLKINVIEKIDSAFLHDSHKEMVNESMKKMKETTNTKPASKKTVKNLAIKGYHKVKISKLKDTPYSKVIVEGRIFNIAMIPTKSEYTILQFAITDLKCAIYVKYFIKKSDGNKLDALSEYQENDYVSLQGEIKYDDYMNENIIIGNNISLLNPEDTQPKDDYQDRRVELNIKTKMSSMDGIATPKQIIDRAKFWNHKAVAITDLDSVQSFPDLYNISKKDKDLKVIFGASLNVIDRDNKTIKNSQNRTLLNDKYIIFDLETTGLSPILEHIIEFGAVKIENGNIIDKKQFFINPGIKVSSFITELTGIKNADLKNAINEEQGIKEIIQYIEDYTLVAHNANFDFTFLNEKCEKYNLEEIKNPIIDTLAVARLLDPTRKNYRLGTVAKRLWVEYDSTIAHRADYDAQVLSSIWIKQINELANKNINNQEELKKFPIDSFKNKLFASSINVLAKNQKGLKELFQLISQASTTDYAFGSKLLFDTVKKQKNVLIGSGGLGSRLQERMFFGSKEQIRQEITHYDYIEVQPINNYLHLINRGISKEKIQQIIKFVIDESLKQNKLIVATSDARYINESDKIYHEIYINAKGLGGSRHKLFKYNEDDPIYPNLHYRSTQEMIDEFKYLEDLDLIKNIVIYNTWKIEEQIEKVEVIKDKLYTPIFGDADKNLKELTYKNAREKYGDKLPKIIEDRLTRELDPIIKYGFAVIYWISHLLVKKSLDDGYLVGSRGSVGSSLVATMTNITEVNPMPPHYLCQKCKYSEFFEDSKLNSGYDLPNKKCPKCNRTLDKDGQNIPFETFLGFEADKVPDIDLNFSGEYQAVVHQEVKKLFGKMHTFRAGTISTVAEKTAFGYVKGWAEQKGIDISKAFIEYLAKGVAGTKRTTGQHPGGIIVIPHKFDVEDFTPINFPANDVNSAWRTTHFDFHAIHDNVLKLDLLGHDDPTAIKQLEKLTGLNAKKDIPFYDKKVISLFSSPEALGIKSEDINDEPTGAMGIPEFGTKFVRQMLKSTNVKSFGDLIAVSGLSHGTDVWTSNAELLVKNKKLTLSDTISCRDNIMLDLISKGIKPKTAFSIMENVRKGKGITRKEEQLLMDHNIKEWYIDSLQKIKYMFPKAHATAYVMMAWRIAWFKLYKPLAYYTTYFTSRADYMNIEVMKDGKERIVKQLKDFITRRYKKGDDKLSNKEQAMIPILEIANEMYARGFSISNIDIHKSLDTEWIMDEKNKTIIPPLTALDGLGINAAKSVIEARKDGEFISIDDLSSRTLLNKTNLAKLRELGVLNELPERSQMSFDLDI